jgi:hypothetical protein
VSHRRIVRLALAHALTAGPAGPPRALRESPEVHQTQAKVYGVMVGLAFTPVLVLLAIRLGFGLGGTLALLLLGAPALGIGTYRAVFALSERAGLAAQTLYAPTGFTTPYARTFSYQEAMAMRGDVAGALASYEALMTELPHDVAVRFAAAALYADKGRDAARAAALYREARLLPAATRANELAATNALIDLYRGPLADEARMLVELRRLAERFAGTPPGELARAAIAAHGERPAGSGS